MSNKPSYDVVGIGNAIVDALAPTGDDVLARLQLNKGSMTLIDESSSARIYAEMGPATISNFPSLTSSTYFSSSASTIPMFW